MADKKHPKTPKATKTEKIAKAAKVAAAVKVAKTVKEGKAAKKKAAQNTIVKTKRSKFKCATTGKHFCDECGKGIERGDIIRMVDVKFADKTADQYKFCSKECRNKYCDSNGVPR